MNLYNENDPRAAAWLRELIACELIAPGIVDERSIKEINASELHDYAQCHFFAGIGGWSFALRLAGWNDDRPVWTCSCPCQPYSVASVGHGGAKGGSDSRNLWPDFNRLAAERKPPVILGEQVASAISWGWWDRAAMDLEASAYSVGASVLRADAIGAAHERKRLYWMAVAGRERREGHQPIERFPFAAETAFPVNGDSFTRARRALAGDYSDLLPCDGLSIQVERDALKGYGNAIVPQVAAAFIEACNEVMTTTSVISGNEEHLVDQVTPKSDESD